MSVQSHASPAKSGHACLSCRSRKVRCITNLQTGDCFTCERSGATCERKEPKRRVRKEKLTSKARIAALESRLEQLASGLAVANEHEHSSSQASFDRDASSNSTTDQEAPSWATSVGSSGQDECSTDGHVGLVHMLYQHNVSPEDAEQYLVRFREMTLYFPFVVLPADSALSSLAEGSPMLLLAALAAASSPNKRAQMLLESTLRVNLLESILLNGEKSLDLLAALLVYLAWYQFYCVPKKEAFSQLIQMAISMCHDLGLHLRPEEAATVKIGMNLQHYQKAEDRQGKDDEFFSSNARRLLLGCYYLSCSASIIRGIPSPLLYTDYMGQCAASLARESQYPTDSAIPCLIQQQHLTDHYHGIFRRARGATHTPTSVANVRSDLAAVQAQLQATMTTISPILQQTTFIDLSFHTASILIHEMDLINPFADKTLSAHIDDTNSFSASLNAQVRLEILFLCLEGAKNFFQSFLTIPACEYRSLSMVQWNSLIFATMVLYKLSIGLASMPEWSPEVARRSVPLETYLETCCQLMSVATSACVPDESEQGHDLFSLMPPIWRNVKDTYLRLRELPWNEAVADQGDVHAISFPGMSPSRDSLPSPASIRHRCPAFSFWGRKATG